MKSILTIVAAAALSAMALTAQGVPSPLGKFAEFTAKVRETYFDELGQQTQFLDTFYRRNDDSFSLIGETNAPGDFSPGGLRGTFAHIVNTANRTYTEVDPFTKSYVVLPLSEREAWNHADEYSCSLFSDGSWTTIGETRRLGLRALEVQGQLSENDSGRRVIVPELNCYPLVDLLLEKGEVRTKKEVLSLQMGAPDPAAFLPPAGFTAVSPMQLENLYREKFGTEHYGDEKARKLETRHQEGKAKGLVP